MLHCRPQGAPRGLRDALGGDLMVSLLAAINFPLPFPALQAAGIHGQVGGLGRAGRQAGESRAAPSGAYRAALLSGRGPDAAQLRDPLCAAWAGFKDCGPAS